MLVSVFLAGGVDSLSLLAPVGDPQLPELRPKLALADSEGTPFAEDGRLHWHPSADGFSTLHGEGKVTVMPAIGYEHPDQSHFNSRHFWEVGALDRRLVTGWLGRFLDRVGHAGQPAPGPLARRRALARAGHRARAGLGRQRARRLRLLGARRVGRRRELDARGDARRSAARTPAAGTPACGRPGGSRSSRRSCASS